MLLAMNVIFIPFFFTLALTSQRISTTAGEYSMLLRMPTSLIRYAETKKTRKRSLFGRAFLAVLPVAGYLFVLSYVPVSTALESGDAIRVVLARLTVVGTVILGLLSGFGAASNAWDYYPLSSSGKRCVPDCL